MPKLTFSTISLAELQSCVDLREGTVGNYAWNQVSNTSLTAYELQRANEVSNYLLNRDTTLMNEATVWGKAIFPLLTLAE